MHHPAMPRQKDTGPRLHSSSHFHRLLTVTKAPARVPVGLQAEPGCPRPGTIFPGDDGVVAAASAPASRRAALAPESPRAGRGVQGQQRAATTSLSAGGLSQPSLRLTGRGTGPKGSPSSSFSHAVPPPAPGTQRVPAPSGPRCLCAPEVKCLRTRQFPMLRSPFPVVTTRSNQRLGPHNYPHLILQRGWH